MVYDEFKYRMLAGLFDLAGQVVSSQINKPNYDEQEKAMSRYYRDAIRVAKEDDNGEKEKLESSMKEMVPKLQRQAEELIERSEREKQQLIEEVSSDLAPEKVSHGTACLPCSRDHFSTVSGALNEAIRFARREGVGHPEVARRIGMSLDELNMLERIDLAPEETVQLKGREKDLADWGLEQSRDLRHDITGVKTTKDLERVAAKASKIRTEYMQELWDLATVDGSIQKLCEKLKGEEKQKCLKNLDEVLMSKKKNPP